MAVSACRCGPDSSTSVTLRIKNTESTPIFVDATDGRLGMIVHRSVGGDWMPFVETPRCECLSCDLVCGGCACDLEQQQNTVLKLDPGQTIERVWNGVVQIDSSQACDSSLFGGTPCLRSDIPPLDEEFQLQFCYATSARGAENAQGGEVVPGSLPEPSTLCSEKRFRVEDLVVEVSPGRGASCVSHADCTGDGELCFNGACTRTCPATGFPLFGGSWQVRIPQPEDQGFFEWRREGRREVYKGAGTLGSVRYENGTMILQLSRPGPAGGPLKGTVTVALPEGVAAPLTLGEVLHVVVVDASSEDNPENRALVVRDEAGGLLLAAETAQMERILTDAEIAPFRLSRGEEIVGCEHSSCGKNLFHATRFTAGGQTFELDPGAVETVVSDGQTWTVANVTNARYAETRCALGDVMPWAIANQRAHRVDP